MRRHCLFIGALLLLGAAGALGKGYDPLRSVFHDGKTIWLSASGGGLRSLHDSLVLQAYIEDVAREEGRDPPVSMVLFTVSGSGMLQGPRSKGIPAACLLDSWAAHAGEVKLPFKAQISSLLKATFGFFKGALADARKFEKKLIDASVADCLDEEGRLRFTQFNNLGVKHRGLPLNCFAKISHVQCTNGFSFSLPLSVAASLNAAAYAQLNVPTLAEVFHALGVSVTELPRDVELFDRGGIINAPLHMADFDKQRFHIALDVPASPSDNDMQLRVGTYSLCESGTDKSKIEKGFINWIIQRRAYNPFKTLDNCFDVYWRKKVRETVFQLFQRRDKGQYVLKVTFFSPKAHIETPNFSPSASLMRRRRALFREELDHVHFQEAVLAVRDRDAARLERWFDELPGKTQKKESETKKRKEVVVQRRKAQD